MFAATNGSCMSLLGSSSWKCFAACVRLSVMLSPTSFCDTNQTSQQKSKGHKRPESQRRYERAATFDLPASVSDQRSGPASVSPLVLSLQLASSSLFQAMASQT